MMQNYLHYVALPALGLVFVGCVIAIIVTVIRGIGRPRPTDD